MVIFSEITERECVNERHPHWKATIRLVQHCAAISAMAEVLFHEVRRSKKVRESKIFCEGMDIITAITS